MDIGDVYVIDLEPTRGHEQSKVRPCVILSRQELNTSLGTVIIAPLTSHVPDKQYPNLVFLERGDANLPKAGTIKVEQLRCIDKSRIQKFVGRLSEVKVEQLKSAIVCVFKLREFI